MQKTLTLLWQILTKKQQTRTKRKSKWEWINEKNKSLNLCSFIEDKMYQFVDYDDLKYQ